MKRYLYILALILSSVGCARREAIPDSVLSDIFHDVMLVNAYKSQFQFKMDSIQLYEPIFEKYGYTAEDVNYTVGNFSKRKSARLSDVVEVSIKKLEKQNNYFKHEVQILDSIDAIALRRARTVIYSDSVMRMRMHKDSAEMFILLEDIEQGDYHITFDYLVDSLDRNNLSYRTLAWFERSKAFTRSGASNDRVPQRFKQSSTYLTRRKISTYDKTMTIDENYDKLRIQLVEWRGKLRFPPYVTIRNLEVSYTPRVESAVEKFYQEKLNLKILAPSLYEPYNIPEPVPQADSLELHTTGE